MDTRIIGIDLAVKGSHKASVLDQASNTYVGKLLTFGTNPADLDRVPATARTGAPDDVRFVQVRRTPAVCPALARCAGLAYNAGMRSGPCPGRCWQGEWLKDGAPPGARWGSSTLSKAGRLAPLRALRSWDSCPDAAEDAD